MACLLCDTSIANSQGMREHPAARHGAGRIAGRDELDVEAGRDQAPGEDVDDVLGATVANGGDGQPRRCDDTHAQRPLGGGPTWGFSIDGLAHDPHRDRRVGRLQGS